MHQCTIDASCPYRCMRRLHLKTATFLQVYYIPRRPFYAQSTLPTVAGNLRLLRVLLIREGITLLHAHQAFSALGLEALVHARTMGYRVGTLVHAHISGYRADVLVRAHSTTGHRVGARVHARMVGYRAGNRLRQTHAVSRHTYALAVLGTAARRHSPLTRVHICSLTCLRKTATSASNECTLSCIRPANGAANRPLPARPLPPLPRNRAGCFHRPLPLRLCRRRLHSHQQAPEGRPIRCQRRDLCQPHQPREHRAARVLAAGARQRHPQRWAPLACHGSLQPSQHVCGGAAAQLAFWALGGHGKQLLSRGCSRFGVSRKSAVGGLQLHSMVVMGERLRGSSPLPRELVKLGQTWSNLVELGQTWSNILLYPPPPKACRCIPRLMHVTRSSVLGLSFALTQAPSACSRAL